MLLLETKETREKRLQGERLHSLQDIIKGRPSVAVHSSIVR